MSESTPPPATGDFWGSWFSTAKQQALELASKAQELAESAGKVAQEQASNIVKQAQELRENYDLEVATSILMSTVGGPINPNGAPTPSASIDQIKLTKADLSQLDMIYVTENLISMAFPRDKAALALNGNQKMASTAGDAEGGGPDEGNDINVVAAYLRKKHQGRFMIWNISEESYDYSKFADQVLEYRFPGHPAPPLGLLFKICTSVESWLDADEKNVAVIHCLTGKGRTATLLACILTWLGEFDSPMQALQYVANRRNTVVDYLTIPSQRRYIQYFSNLLDGVRPNSEPLILRRVIINSIPIFGKFSSDDEATSGCCPYIQLFKNGKLIATAASYAETKGEEDVNVANSNSKLQLRWVNSSEGTASFRIDCPVQGDILLRCRHAAVSGARISMFRAAFHTGYITGGVLRLTKAQLDGTGSDSRYSEDFFIDLIFAPLSSLNNDASSHNATILPEAAEADKYETSIHKDARFWESVAARKVKSKKRKSRKFLSSQQDQFSIADDSKVLLDHDSLIEISFLDKDTDAGKSIKGSSYQQDMDLIKQLAELESDVGGSPAASTGSAVASSSTTTMVGSNVESQTFSKPSSLTNSNVAIDLTPSTPKTTGSVKVELQALEDLEKELGLSDLHLFSADKKSSTSRPAVSTTPKPTPTKFVDDDDNLDELEKYLQSLSSNTSN
jgi:tensin